MKHFMKLNRIPFEMIASDKKTIELRLYDEKRQLIKPGDEIEFTCTEDNGKKLLVRVKALHRFAGFKELYEEMPLESCGYEIWELDKADPSDMEKYYSRQQQEKYGVVGIEIELV